MLISQRLELARKVIEKPENWTQGEMARASDNTPMPIKHAAATCFCSIGAVLKVSNMSYAAVFSSDEYKYLRKTIDEKVTKFNDTHTHEEVLAMFDNAIELAKSEDN